MNISTRVVYWSPIFIYIFIYLYLAFLVAGELSSSISILWMGTPYCSPPTLIFSCLESVGLSVFNDELVLGLLGLSRSRFQWPWYPCPLPRHIGALAESLRESHPDSVLTFPFFQGIPRNAFEIMSLAVSFISASAEAIWLFVCILFFFSK